VVEAAGFKKSNIPSIRLNLNDNLSVNIPLEVGQVSETVNVEASAVSVELQSAAAAGLVNGTQVRELQLNSRNFAQLISWCPAFPERIRISSTSVRWARSASTS